MHGGASWGVNAPGPAQLARLKMMRSAMASNLSTSLPRSMCHPTWKGEYPVLGAEWVPFDKTQCIIAAMENGILVVHNVVSNTRVPLFTPFDIKTFSSSSRRPGDAAVAQPRPGQTVAADLKYGCINTVAVAAQKPNQLLSTDYSMVVAWNYQDHIATCCLDAGRREPVPNGLSKIAAIPTGLTPENIHLKFSPYFQTKMGGSGALCRLLACVVSESETASSRLLISMQDPESCAAKSSTTTDASSSSSLFPKFTRIVLPWKLIHGEVIHIQWLSPCGSTAEPTDVAGIHAHQPVLLLGTSDGRLTILRVNLPPASGGIGGGGADVICETVFVSSSAVSHLDVQLFSSTYKHQEAAFGEHTRSLQKPPPVEDGVVSTSAAVVPSLPSFTVKCDYVLYFVALGNIIHNATISISWMDLFGGNTSPASASASIPSLGTKRARSTENAADGNYGDAEIPATTTTTVSSLDGKHQQLGVFVTPLTSTCTDDAVVYGIQSALISGSFVLYCFVSSSVIALDGGTLSTLFVTPFTRHRSAVSSSSSSGGSSNNGALFSSSLALRPIRLVPRDKPPFLGVVDGERFVLLRDGNSSATSPSTHHHPMASSSSAAIPSSSSGNDPSSSRSQQHHHRDGGGGGHHHSSRYQSGHHMRR